MEASARHPQPGRYFQYGTAGVSHDCTPLDQETALLTIGVVPHESVRLYLHSFPQTPDTSHGLTCQGTMGQLR